MDDNYKHKYSGSDYEKAIISFHASRRMFVIKEDSLILAPKNVDYSHAHWFSKEKWSTESSNLFMETVTRGYYDAEGVFFYKGYGFKLDSDAEKAMFNHLDELVNITSLDTSLHLFGGKDMNSSDLLWPPIKDYGILRSLL